MRKTTNLVAAGALAVSGFATTAAAQQQAAGCDNPDDREVVDLASAGEYSRALTYVGQPMGGVTWDTAGAGLHSRVFFLADVKGRKADINVSVTWLADGDYDALVDDPEGNEILRSESSSLTDETFVWEDVEDCTAFDFRVFNFTGSPANDMTITFTLAD